MGNPGGENAFIHVFDEANLNVVLQELDTIGDLLIYLRARQRLFLNNKFVNSHSEEDLLALFLRNMNAQGEHDFVFDEPEEPNIEQFFIIEEGYYLSYAKRPEYKRKKKADKRSYFWDRLIESFAKNLSEGTLAPLPEEFIDFDGGDGSAEIGLRYMALEPRIMRRAHSEAILGAFDSLSRTRSDRFFRAMLPLPTATDKTGFFILLVKRNGALADLPYQDYRRYRAMIAHAYSQNLLQRNRELNRVVGIATEGEIRGGRSEDLIYQEQIEWTDKALEETAKLAKVFDVFKNDSERQYSTEEYPRSDLGLKGDYNRIPYQFFQVPEQRIKKPLVGNRSERRKQAARLRKLKKQKD